MTKIRATTWNHVRAVAPLAAAAQIFSDRNPDVVFEVVPHSAKQFGEGPLGPLARDFDLVVFDYPLTGWAAEEELFLPLDECLAAGVLEDRRQHSVGASYQSYVYDGHVWGLPLDAACMVSASRPDTHGAIPTSWEELMALAEAGRVRQGFSRMTTTAMFYMLVHQGIDEEAAVSRLRQLYQLAGGPVTLDQGSIQVLEAAATGNEVDFIPACYGYSNYCRAGFALHPMQFHPSPLAPAGGAVLGGAGLAVAKSSKHREIALQFLEWVTGADCQTNVYAVCGGQPAHASAWNAALPNGLADHFFTSLLPTMQSSWQRPNTPGFHQQQSELATRLRAELLK